MHMLTADSHWGRHKNHSIAAHEQHGNGALCGFVDFFVCFLIDLDRGHSLFSIAENHVQMLIEGLGGSMERMSLKNTTNCELTGKLFRKTNLHVLYFKMI